MPLASIRFDPAFFQTALRRYRRQHRLRFVRTGLKVVALAFLTVVAVQTFREGQWPLGLFLLALWVFVLLAHRVDAWRGHRLFAQSPYFGEIVAIRFSEEGFHALSAKHDVRLAWTAFTKAVHFRDGVLLFQGPGAFIWIPFSALSAPSEAAELQELLRSRIAEHRWLEGPPVAAP